VPQNKPGASISLSASLWLPTAACLVVDRDGGNRRCNSRCADRSPGPEPQRAWASCWIPAMETTARGNPLTTGQGRRPKDLELPDTECAGSGLAAASNGRVWVTEHVRRAAIELNFGGGRANYGWPLVKPISPEYPVRDLCCGTQSAPGWWIHAGLGTPAIAPPSGDRPWRSFQAGVADLFSPVGWSSAPLVRKDQPAGRWNGAC